MVQKGGPKGTSSAVPRKNRSATAVRIPVDPGDQVGTDDRPYKLSSESASRRASILAGAVRRMEEEGMTVREALTQVKRRLNAIRVLNRRRGERFCAPIEADMRWLDETVYDGGGTGRVCSAKAGERVKKKNEKRA